MGTTIDDQIAYWKDTADHDWGTAISLFKSKRYDACLFFCHLTIEKTLKALVVEKTREPAPYIHKLVQLAEAASIKISKKQKAALEDISTFNISGRYDNVKRAFYKKCTKEYTEKNLKRSEKILSWLRKKYQKK